MEKTGMTRRGSPLFAWPLTEWLGGIFKIYFLIHRYFSIIIDTGEKIEHT
jgi:hypothetical protein